MTLLMPKVTRRTSGAYGREWSLMVPMFARQGHGYDILTDSFKTGGWSYIVRLTFIRDYDSAALRVSWGRSLYCVAL